jgi:hypothetical protein
MLPTRPPCDRVPSFKPSIEKLEERTLLDASSSSFGGILVNFATSALSNIAAAEVQVGLVNLDVATVDANPSNVNAVVQLAIDANNLQNLALQVAVQVQSLAGSVNLLETISDNAAAFTGQPLISPGQKAFLDSVVNNAASVAVQLLNAADDAQTDEFLAILGLFASSPGKQGQITPVPTVTPTPTPSPGPTPTPTPTPPPTTTQHFSGTFTGSFTSDGSDDDRGSFSATLSGSADVTVTGSPSSGFTVSGSATLNQTPADPAMVDEFTDTYTFQVTVPSLGSSVTFPLTGTTLGASLQATGTLTSSGFSGNWTLSSDNSDSGGGTFSLH